MGTKNEWLGLIDAVGLNLDALGGDFDGSPFTPNCREYVFVRRARDRRHLVGAGVPVLHRSQGVESHSMTVVDDSTSPGTLDALLAQSADFRDPADFIGRDIALALVALRLFEKGLVLRVPMHELDDWAWSYWATAGPNKPSIGQVLDAIVTLAEEEQIATAPRPVGLTEIAQQFRVKPATAQMWRYRGRLPEPRWTVSGNPAWDDFDINAWAVEQLDTGAYPRPDPS
ncbi:MAG: hypothetical protein ACLFRV_05915 [Acidimicrobiales bacterium]